MHGAPLIDAHDASCDANAATGDEADDFGERFAFGGEDAGGEGVGRVVVEDRHDALQDDRAVVVLIINEVNGATADLRAIVEHRFVNVMPVHSPTAEGGN